MESSVSGTQFQEPDSNSTLVLEPLVSSDFQDPALTQISSNSEYFTSPLPSKVSQTYEAFSTMTPSNFLTNTMEVLTSTPMNFETNPFRTGYDESFTESTLTPLLTPSERAENMKHFESIQNMTQDVRENTMITQPYKKDETFTSLLGPPPPISPTSKISQQL